MGSSSWRSGRETRWGKTVTTIDSINLAPLHVARRRREPLRPPKRRVRASSCAKNHSLWCSFASCSLLKRGTDNKVSLFIFRCVSVVAGSRRGTGENRVFPSSSFHANRTSALLAEEEPPPFNRGVVVFTHTRKGIKR